MRRTEFCKHYRAMSDHDTCCKGIAYDTFKGLTFDQRPCFERNGVAPPGCELAEFLTAEEREQRDREDEERFAKTVMARVAIVEHCGEWKPGKPGASGVIDCPACGGIATLRYSMAGYNGHIHAKCQRGGCVSWME